MKRISGLNAAVIIGAALVAGCSTQDVGQSPSAAQSPSPSPDLSTAPSASPSASPDVEVATPGPTEPASADPVEATIVNFAFMPSTIEVASGSSVTWINLDSAPHTVTSGSPDAPDGRFDSGLLEEGETFEMTFDEAGTYEYFCDRHPRMRGQITVSG